MSAAGRTPLVRFEVDQATRAEIVEWFGGASGNTRPRKSRRANKSAARPSRSIAHHARSRALRRSGSIGATADAGRRAYRARPTWVAVRRDRDGSKSPLVPCDGAGGHRSTAGPRSRCPDPRVPRRDRVEPDAQAGSLGTAAPARAARGGMDARAGAGTADRVRTICGPRRAHGLRSGNGSTRPAGDGGWTSIRRTCCPGSPGAPSVAAGSPRTRESTGASACSSTAARRSGSAARRCAPTTWSRAWTALDAEVLATLEDDIMRPTVVEEAIRLALAELAPARQTRRQATARGGTRTVRGVRRLADAIARGGPLDVLVERLTARQATTRGARGELAAERQIVSLRKPARARGAAPGEARRLARTATAECGGGTRACCAQLLIGPLRFTPVNEERRRGYVFEGLIALDRLIAGVLELPTKVASPEGFEPSFQP